MNAADEVEVLAAERIVLGAMMLDPSLVAPVTALLTPGCYHSPVHGIIHDRIVAAYRAGQPAEPVALAHQLHADGQLERLGGAPYLHTLVAAVPATASGPYYAAIVAEHAGRRRLAVLGARLLQAAEVAEPDRRQQLVAGVSEELAAPRAAMYAAGRVRPLVRRLFEVAPESLSWLWPGYFARGKLHVVDGDPGLGKSTMTLDLAARVTTGKPWPDGTHGVAPAAVLLLSHEDGLADTIRPRLDAAGADVDRVYAWTAVTGSPAGPRTPSFPADVEHLHDLIGEHQASLVVVDPIMAYLDAGVDSYRDQAVRRSLAPLSRLAEQHAVAILLIRHLKKGDGPALYRGGGSIGIIGAARFAYLVGRDPDAESRRVLASTKSNLTVEPAAMAFELVDHGGVARVDWQGPVRHRAEDLLHPDDREDRAERDYAAQWLRSYLGEQGGQAPAGDIFKAGAAAGFERHTLRRAQRRAGARPRKTAFSGPWMWTLAGEDDEDDSSVSPSSPSPLTSPNPDSDPRPVEVLRP
jgi:hypothetical protein